MRRTWPFAFLAALVLAGELLAAIAARALPAGLAQWAAYGVPALVLAALGALAPDQRTRPTEQAAAELATVRLELAKRLEWQRRLRHDLRGVLSPALLTADRLLTNADPKVQRAGDMMVQAVERAAALLAQPDD